MTLLHATGLVALALALAVVGGAIAGVKLGGEHLGKDLAALMGAFFGPSAVLPAVIVGLIVLGMLR